MNKKMKLLAKFLCFLLVFNQLFFVYDKNSTYANEKLMLIMGQAEVNQNILIKELMNVNKDKKFDYASNFVKILFEEANAEGVRADVAFAQIMKETNYLKFTGTVQEHQNNFGGIGVTGEVDPETGKPVQGASFPDIRTGLRANIQHLKAYASKEPLKNQCVDPRFKYVKRGSAIYVEWLGIKENPEGYGWAASERYGYDIVDMVNKYKGRMPVEKVSLEINDSKFWVGKAYTLVAKTVGNTDNLYQFWILDKQKDQWTILKDWSSSNTIQFTPKNIGEYKIEVHVKNKLSENKYDALDYKDITVKVNTSASNAHFTINSDKFYINDEYTINAKGNANNRLLYQYWLLDKEKNEWILLLDWSEKNKCNFKIDKKGQYRVELHIKDSESKKNYDDLYFKDISVNDRIATNAYFSINSDVFYSGQKYEINGKGEDSNQILYQYWMLDKQKDEWLLLSDWSEKNKTDLKFKNKGEYRIELHIKDKSSKNKYDSIYFKDVSVNGGYASDASVKLDKNILITNKEYKIQGNGKSPNEVLYQYWVLDKQKDKWLLLSDWSNSKEIKWIPKNNGHYRVELHIKDKNSDKNYDDVAFVDVQVFNKVNASEVTLNLSSQTMYVNDSYKISANAKTDNKALYQFWVLDKQKDNWIIIRDWSENNEVFWQPKNKGNYRIEVHAKDITSNKSFDVLSYNDVTVREKGFATNANINIDKVHMVNRNLKIVASGDSPNYLLFQFWVLDKEKDEWILLKDWSKTSFIDWTPKKAGDYRIEVHLKDSSSSKNYDTLDFIDINVLNQVEIIDPFLDFDFGSEGPLPNKPIALVLHHAEASKASVYDVHRWHKEAPRNWAGIGYHFYIRKDGTIYKGREENWRGAHAPAYNDKSLGICVEGAYSRETMPQAQKEAVIKLGKYLVQKYNMHEVYKHKDVTATNCPGDNYPFTEIKKSILDLHV